MKMRLRVSRHYPLHGDTAEVEVELRQVTHWNQRDRAYEVIVLGETEPRGKIERALENTDRHYGRIRVPGKGRPAWAWRRSWPERKSNSPGVYEHNRAYAVARVLGWDRGVVVK